VLYSQDRWLVRPNLSLSLGLRWNRQRLYDADQQVQADIDDSLAPRLGFVWDAVGNGKSRVFGQVGWFFETVPMDIVISSFTTSTSAFFYNYSDDPDDVAGLIYNPSGPADETEIGRRSNVLGSSTTSVDPGISGQYVQETMLGAEYEIMTNLVVGMTLIQRDLERAIENALAADGEYYIGNPGEGMLTGTYDIGYAYGYNAGDYENPEDHPNYHRVPSPRRTYRGLELTIQKGFSNRFQLLFSALFSHLDGNFEGNFQATTGQLNPNHNTAYDYYDFMVNNDGDLSGDRRQQYKLNGVYRFDWGLNVGLSAYYRTGTPVTALGYSSPFDNWEYCLSQRGAFGRVDSDYEMDLRLGYPVKLGTSMELHLLLDILNVLDRQGEIRRDQRYTTSGEAYYTVIDWETGIPYPAITPENAEDRPPTNPGFNTATRWQHPRLIRLGLRLSF